MKVVKFMVLPLAMVLLGFSSCDDDDNLKVDSAFTAALTEKYPQVTRAEWENKGNYVVADCHIDNKDADVWFTSGAEWVMTELELLKSDLPTAVSQALAATDYATWWIDDVDVLHYASKASEYVVEVEKDKKEIDLYFSESGEFLREKDVTKGDDTHWPE